MHAAQFASNEEIISAAEGDKDAAQRAKSMGRLLNDESR